MAVLANNALTLADYNSRLDPDGDQATIINILSQSNELLDDMMWMEGNLATGHKTTQLVGIPQGAWRLLNYGVPYVKGSTAQVIDSTGMLEAYTKTDKALVDLAKDPRSFRFGEEQIVIQGLAQQMATTLFYGSVATNPAAFTGLASRYSTVNAATSPNAVNVLDGGGTGSVNTSIYLVCWGQNTVTGIYPRGSTAGLSIDDVTTNAPVYDANGLPFQAYQSHLKWAAGLSLRDWRYVVRISNIDVTNLRAGTGAALVDLMIQALNQIPVMPSGATGTQTTAGQGGIAGAPVAINRAAFYTNRTIKTWLQIQMRKDRTAFVSVDNVAGRPVTSFLGVPVRTVDALLNTEARVV